MERVARETGLSFALIHRVGDGRDILVLTWHLRSAVTPSTVGRLDFDEIRECVEGDEVSRIQVVCGKLNSFVGRMRFGNGKFVLNGLEELVRFFLQCT